MSTRQKGYTIVELLIVISVTGVLIGLVIAFTVGYSRFAASLQLISDSLVARLNLSDYFREKLGTSAGLINQNSLADTNTGNPDTSITPAYFWKTLHAIPGNIPMGASGTITPVFYFSRYSQNATGAIIMNGSNPYQDEYVVYLDGNDKTLKVRTIANSSAPSNKAKTSCPASIATASCPADANLIDNVSSIDVRYFSRTGTLIDWTSVYDINTAQYIGPDFPTVEVIELKVNTNVSAKFQSNNLSNSTIIRVALRNT